MAAESSNSAGPRRRAVGKPPLILCPECKIHQVVECTSKQPWSAGKVFYTCPDHRKDGTGCPFYLWEADYLKKLKKKDEKDVEESRVGSEEHGERTMKKTRDGMRIEQDLGTLIRIGYDLAGLIRCLVCLCFIAVVLLLLLVVEMKK